MLNFLYTKPNKLKVFCTQSIDILIKIFTVVFTEDEPSVRNLQSIGIESWQTIARPQTQQNGTLFIFHYENKIVKDAILRIKNKHDVTLVRNLVTILADFLLEELSEREIIENFTEPIIVAIPSDSKRENKRGFNPSELIAKTLCDIVPSLTFMPYALIKIKETKPQKELSRNDRLTNIKHSMATNQKIRENLKDRCVIVIDDITTTGATLTEAKRALLASGAKKVMCVALAH